MVHNLLHKQLATSLVSKSEVARLYPELTKQQHGESISLFLRRGTPVEVEIFDSLLLCALKSLAVEYQLYFSGSGREVVSSYLPDVWQESQHTSAQLIQAMWRTRMARSVVDRMKHLVTARKAAEAQLKKEQKALGGDDSGDSSEDESQQ